MPAHRAIADRSRHCSSGVQTPPRAPRVGSSAGVPFWILRLLAPVSDGFRADREKIDMNNSSSTNGIQRDRPHKSIRIFAAIVLAGALTITAAAFAGRFFTWNLTPSLPRGLYLLRPDLPPQLGSIVLFSVPESVRGLVHRRDYLPEGARLLKLVVALPGDPVCVAKSTLVVRGESMATVRRTDSLGRRLLPVSFCRSIPPDYAFVATPGSLSFDSRYFGPVPLSSLTEVRPLWTF